MRKVFEENKNPEIEFHAIITPKISSNEKSPASFKRIIGDSGLKYLLYMILMKLKYDFFRFLEIIFFKKTEKRKYLSPEEVCRLHNVKTHTVENINSNDTLELVEKISPDISFCIFFNQILKKDFLSLSKGACLNLHPSLLPEYRGMSPVLWMLSEGVEKGGATLHHIVSKLDAGNIISQKSVELTENDSFFTAYRNSAEAGAELIVELLASPGQCPEGKEQPETEKSYGPITKEAFNKVLKKHPFFKFHQSVKSFSAMQM
jgi:methionyl-tRNA formyltransferase